MTHGKNGDTVTLKIAAIMARPAFQKGMADAAAGRWDQAAADKGFAYERGRQFYFGTRKTAIRRTSRGNAHGAQVAAFIRLRNNGSLI